MVEEFVIKSATIEDVKDVFDLSNDELVRKNSFKQKKIKWEDHQKWFKDKLSDKNHLFYIIRDAENHLISQVRFGKVKADEGDISISISPDFRGKGYGADILRLTSMKIVSELNIRKINAYIKPKNIASKTIFEQAGYILKEESQKKMRYEYNAE